MSQFEKDLQLAVQSRMIKEVKETNFLARWNGDGLQIPDRIIQKAWSGIDWDEVIEETKNEIQGRLVKEMANNMITEIKKDAKKLLSIEGVRERLRHEAYPKILEALESGAKED